MSKTLDRSFKKIDKLFSKMQYNNISTNNKRNISFKTYENYASQMKRILRDANEEFGIEKIEDLSLEMFKKLIEKKVENFHDGEFSESSNINSRLSAMRAFSIGIKETNVYYKTKKNSDVINIQKENIDELREFVKTSGVYRKGSDSTVLRAKAEQVFSVVNNVRSEGYNTINRAKAADVALLSLATGARVSSCLKLRAGDIDFENKCITMKQAKGGLTYYVDLDDEDIPLLKSLVGNLKSNQKVFEFTRKDGSFLSNEESRKVVHRYIQEAGTDFFEVEKRIINRDGKEFEIDHIKRFTFHSIRKAFAFKTMTKYIDKIKSQNDILKEVERLSKRDSKILDKYKKLIERSNAYRIKKNKKLKKDGLPLLPLKTEISLKEAITFFTSIHLGHFRNDIVSNYYCRYKEALSSIRF